MRKLLYDAAKYVLHRPLLLVAMGLPLVLALSITLVVKSTQRLAFENICDLVSAKFYRLSPKLRAWSTECYELVEGFSLLHSLDEMIYEMRVHMDKMETSHLEIFAPQEEERVWKGVDEETGIQARGIDGSFVVFNVRPHSPALKAGVKRGDEIISINNHKLLSSFAASRLGGEYLLRRQGKEIRLQVATAKIKIDHKPYLYEDNGIGILKISTFRAGMIPISEWREVSGKLYRLNRLILDLRGNSGGDFPQMLRVLSSFVCKPTTAGVLLRARDSSNKYMAVVDTDDPYVILNPLQSVRKLGLVTFADYPCYKGKLLILVDERTASVTEIFAQAMRQIKGTKILGEVTRGEVVLAVWYSLPLLGPNYSVSIPEADFLGLDGKSIEGVGVSPDQNLFYELEEALEGKDSWISRAKTSF